MMIALWWLLITGALALNICEWKHTTYSQAENFKLKVSIEFINYISCLNAFIDIVNSSTKTSGGRNRFKSTDRIKGTVLPEMSAN
jgi:hypothetical protein